MTKTNNLTLSILLHNINRLSQAIAVMNVANVHPDTPTWVILSDNWQRSVGLSWIPTGDGGTKQNYYTSNMLNPYLFIEEQEAMDAATFLEKITGDRDLKVMRTQYWIDQKQNEYLTTLDSLNKTIDHYKPINVINYDRHTNLHKFVSGVWEGLFADGEEVFTGELPNLHQVNMADKFIRDNWNRLGSWLPFPGMEGADHPYYKRLVHLPYYNCFRDVMLAIDPTLELPETPKFDTKTAAS